MSNKNKVSPVQLAQCLTLKSFTDVTLVGPPASSGTQVSPNNEAPEFLDLCQREKHFKCAITCISIIVKLK